MIYARYFKLSTLFSEKDIKREIKRVVSLYRGYNKGFVFIPLGFKTGLDGSDYSDNLKTVIVEFNYFKAPRYVTKLRNYKQKSLVRQSFKKRT